MASAVVTTVGGASSNSYVSLADATTYFADRSDGADWGSDTNQQTRALFTAIDYLDALPWIGAMLLETQSLQWPRVAVRPIERRPQQRIRLGYETLAGLDGLYDLKGRLWVSTAIPQPIKDAQCEFALALVRNPAALAGAQEVKRIRTGVVTLELQQESPIALGMNLVKPFLLKFGRM